MSSVPEGADYVDPPSRWDKPVEVFQWADPDEIRNDYTPDELQRIEENLSDQYWRLNHLYYVINEQGQRVQFRMNWAQRQLWKSMWYRTLILKARQLGMSTFIQLYMLDCCLFNANIRAGVIAHHRDDAQYMFRDKIRYAYRNLPEPIKAARYLERESAEELLFGNNSSIRVSTGMRSGTLQILHVSEFGKIARKYPEKAREIVTGSFETVHPGQMIFVESTAEGRDGEFFRMVNEARKTGAGGAQLSKLDFRFMFLPWWKHPQYAIDPTNVTLFPPLVEYFRQLQAKYGIVLTTGQKAWYAKKWASLGFDIKREHPSTADEAFEQSVEGAYYAQALLEAREQHRIAKVPHQRGVQVDTWWDLGINDSCSIWFTQTIGTAVHVIDYYENAGEGLEHYWDVLVKRREELGYRFGRHVWPHDGGHKEFGSGKTRQQQAADMGLYVEVAPRGADLLDGIEAVRNFLSICYFDEERCDIQIGEKDKKRRVGLASLEAYRKDWDENLGTWKRHPLHNWASHGADAFRTLAMAFQEVAKVRTKAAAREVSKARSGGWT